MPESNHHALKPGGKYDHSGDNLLSLTREEMAHLLKLRAEKLCKEIDRGGDSNLWEYAAKVVEVINAYSSYAYSHKDELALEFRGFQKFELLLEEAHKAAP